MPKKQTFIRFNTIKEYINDAFKMRSADNAVKKFIQRFIILSQIQTTG